METFCDLYIVSVSKLCTCTLWLLKKKKIKPNENKIKTNNKKPSYITVLFIFIPNRETFFYDNIFLFLCGKKESRTLLTEIKRYRILTPAFMIEFYM